MNKEENLRSIKNLMKDTDKFERYRDFAFRFLFLPSALYEVVSWQVSSKAGCNYWTFTTACGTVLIKQNYSLAHSEGFLRIKVIKYVKSRF